MSVSRSIASNTVMQVAGKFVGSILGVLTVAVMTRALGASGYGAFTTAISFLQFFGILVDFGLTLTMTRMISMPGADENRIASNIVTLRLVSAIVFFGLAPIISFAFPYPPEVRAAIAIGALSFFSMACTQVLTGVFQKHLATGRVAIADIIGRLVLFGGAVAVAMQGLGLAAFVIVLVLANFIQLVISFTAVRKFARISLAFDMGAWRTIIAESWPIGVSIAFNLVYLKGDVIILSVVRPSAEVGLYGAAYKVLDVITVVPMIFMGLVLPMLTAAWVAQRRDDFGRKLSKSFDALSVIALPLAFGAWPVARDLMRLVAGEEFASSGVYLSVLMLAAAAVFWSGLFGHAVVAIGIQRIMISAYAADALLSIMLYAWAVPRYGGLGAAWATVFSEVFIMSATAIAVLIVTRARLPLANFGKALLASILMTAAVYAAQPLHVLLRIGLGIVVYTVLLALFGVLSKELLASFRKTAIAV